MLDLNPLDRKELVHVLNTYIPGIEVRAFGSRVTGRSGKFSDLDIALMTTTPLDETLFRNLKEALSDSNLAITVDCIDFSAADRSFKKIVEQNYEVIQDAEDVLDR